MRFIKGSKILDLISVSDSAYCGAGSVSVRKEILKVNSLVFLVAGAFFHLLIAQSIVMHLLSFWTALGFMVPVYMG